MRLLLLGSEGQLGWELQRALAPLGPLSAVDRCAATAAARVDLAEPESVRDLLRALRPEVIVNAAGYTDVDRAEAEPGLAARINAEAPGVLAEEAARLGAWLVHYGSEHVFDGSGVQPRDEDAATAPPNVYGRSKREGEQRIRAASPRHLILRTSWLFAARGRNFVRSVLALAQERDRLEVVDDQVGAPTAAELVADVTAHALRALAVDERLAGTYHVAAGGAASRLEVARFVVERARALGAPLRLHPDGLIGVATHERPAAALRPLNSRLDCTRLRRSFGLVLPHWTVGVERVLRELLRPEPAASPEDGR